MLKREPILVSLSPTSLRVGVVASGEVARVERVTIEHCTFEEAWEKDLVPLDDTLRQALRSLGVPQGTGAKVVYSAPASVAEVIGVPARGAAARQAVSLYLSQNLPGGGAGWITDFEVLGGSDESPGDQALPGEVSCTLGTGAARTMALTYADKAQDMDVIAAWLRRCGLRCGVMLPTRAGVMSHALRGLLGQTGSHPRVTLHLDEHTLALAGVDPSGNLLLARCAGVGYASIVDAVHRGGRAVQGGEGFTREQASRLVFQQGIPERGQMLDHALQIHADAVLPLIQPALQRIAVEVRQTLRFGMMESDLARVQVRLAGAGRVIPNLLGVLATMLEMPIEPEKDRADTSAQAEDQVGDLLVAHAMDPKVRWLRPSSEQRAEELRRMGRATRVGALVALCMVAGLGAWRWDASRRTQVTLASMQDEVEQAEAGAAAQARAGVRSRQVAAVQSVLRNGLRERPAWRPVFALLSRRDASIDLTEITMTSISGSGAPGLVLRGIAPPAQGSENDPLLALSKMLNDSDLVESAAITSTRTDTARSESGRSDEVRIFAIQVQLRGIPAVVPPVEAGDGALASDLVSESKEAP